MNFDHLLYKYKLDYLINRGYVTRNHNGKDIKHTHYISGKHNKPDIEIDIYVPHYFERLGTERRIENEIKNFIKKERQLKINKLKSKLL